MATYDGKKVQTLAAALTPRRALQLALVYHPGHRPGGPADTKDVAWLERAVAKLNGMSTWERANFMFMLRSATDEAMHNLTAAYVKIARDNDDAQGA